MGEHENFLSVTSGEVSEAGTVADVGDEFERRNSITEVEECQEY